MNWRILLFIPAIAIGVIAYVMINNAAPEPASEVTERPPVPVRVAEVTLAPVPVAVTGYGRVEPVRTWDGISQVDGQVLETIDPLAVGALVSAGETILQVDRRDYEIARDRARANLAIAEAELAELNAQEENTAEQVALEQQIETVIQADVDRRTALVESGSTAISSLEQVQRDLIAQERRVLDLENALALYPVQRSGAEATLASRQVDLEEAERELSNTQVVAPFSGRITEASVAAGVYIRPGDRLLTIAAIDTVEVIAEVQPAAIAEALGLLIPNAHDAVARFNPFEGDAAINVLDAAGIGATVVLSQGVEHRYPAQIVRLDGSVDSTTGTIGVVVQVRDAGLPNPDSRRPPLTNGAFVSVLFEGATHAPMAKVPRAALIEDADGAYVYVVDPEMRLARQAVTVAGRSAGNIVLSEGLAAGTQIVLTPPEPAILGSLLAPIQDSQEVTR